MAAFDPAELYTHGIPLESAYLDAKEIRDNLAALAQTFLTTDILKPLDAREGQVRVNAAVSTNVTLDVFLSGAWRPIAQNIQDGTAAPVKLIQAQAAASSWVIDHNLGSQVVAQVYDASFVQLSPVNVFQPRNIPLARIDTSLAVGAALTGFPLEFNGLILATFAVVEGAPLVGAGPLAVDLVIDKTPGGGASTPIGGGTVTLAAAATGDVIAGAGVIAPNTFLSSGSPLAADVLDIVTTGTPLTSGIVNIWARTQRTLNPGEYRLTHVNENRISIDHPEPTSGFVVLVG